MAQRDRGKAVAQFRPRIAQLQLQIRSVASDSRNVNFGNHALDRMELRSITTLDALRVLRFGDIHGDVQPGRQAGEWKCKVVARKRGHREIGVVTIILRTGRLFVKTVEWEDL